VAPRPAAAATLKKSTALASLQSKDSASLSEAMKKLLAENERLKQEKEQLERQLAAKQVAHEREQLRRSLKNKLWKVDRKLKVKRH